MSIYSGFAGGGGAFVMIPLMIFLGLTPAQAVSTGKLGGLSLAIGSLVGMREVHGRLSKWRIIPVVVLAFVIGLAVPYLIKSLDSDVYRVALGVLILVMAPILLIKKVGIKPHKPKLWQKYAGTGLLGVALLLQGVFSGGLGSLVNVVLMGMLGMTATEANVTKRWSQVVLNVTIVLGVLGSGLIVWEVVAVSVPVTMLGGYIGGKIAMKRGDTFVLKALVSLMIVSGLTLIFGM